MYVKKNELQICPMLTIWKIMAWNSRAPSFGQWQVWWRRIQLSQVAEDISPTDYKLLSTTINYYIYVLSWLKTATKSQCLNISLTGIKRIGQWITSTIKIQEYRSKQSRETNQSRHVICYPKKILINLQSQHPKPHLAKRISRSSQNELWYSQWCLIQNH